MLPAGHPLAALQAGDRAALGVVLAQTIFCALAEGAGASCSDGLERLLVEVFHNDIAAFRHAQPWCVCACVSSACDTGGPLQKMLTVLGCACQLIIWAVHMISFEVHKREIAAAVRCLLPHFS